MLTIHVNVDGLERKFTTLAENAADLKPALQQFGGYLRKRAALRYKAQDFAPLAASTLENRAQRGLASMQTKLRADVRRAIRRAGGYKKQGILAKFFGTNDGVARALATQSKGAQNRLAVLAEFQQRHDRRKNLVEAANAKPLTIKQQASLGARTDRAVARAVGKPILGKLAGSLEVEVKQGTVTLRSRTRGNWSEVHNKGGTAGKGAVIPERKTVEVTSEDLDLFEQILKERMLLGFEE